MLPRHSLPLVLLGACLYGSTAQAAEIVHLASGFDLSARGHVLNGSSYTLETDTGTIDIPASEVTGIDICQAAPAAQNSNQLVAAAPVTLTALVQQAAASQAGNPEFIRFVQSVAEVESAFRQDARSPKGATGIMQLMPGTAKDLGVLATDAADNVRGGARYLRELLERYHHDSALALAAYNAGPGAVSRYGGVPPYLETRLYIQKVLAAYSRNSHLGGILK